MPVQTKIIDSVNELLKKKGFQLKLNTGGVCGGLASIYVKYFLEGKEAEFFEMERKLANPPKNYNMGDDPDFDNFIKDVEIAFNSQIYHKGTYQGDLNEILKFDGKPVNNEYNIGLVDTRAKWGEILGSIKNEGRACYVASNNHAIAISFSNNRYVVYDPNYDEDNNKKINNTKSFDTAAKAIEEIEKCFGDVNPSNLYRDYLGISVRAFAHPNEKRAAVYPSKTDLHRTHFSTPPSLTRRITHPDGYAYDSMTCAIRANDTDTIQHLFQHIPLNAGHVVSAEHHTRYKLAFDMFNRLNVIEAERVLLYMSQHGSADLFKQMLDNYFATKSNDPLAFKQKFVRHSNPTVKITSLLEYAVKGKDKKNIEVLAQFLKAHSIDASSHDIDPIIEALKKNVKKDKSGILENLFLHFPDLINEKMVADLLKIAAENNSSKSLKILLQQVSRLGSASKDSIFDEKIISKITPDNLKLLADANIPIPQSLFATALNRKEPAIFATCVGALSGNDPWVHFLKKAVDGKFKKGEKLPISLFDAGKPYTPFKVLTRFPNNNQIILDNWPTRKIPQFTKNEALSWAVESGNVEIAEKLRQSGATLKIDTLEKLIADYPNRQDKMYNFLLDRLKTLIVGHEETLASHAAQVIHRARFHDTPDLLKEVAVLFRDSRLLDQSHLIPALNPEMKAMQTASGDELIRLTEAVKNKKYPAEKYAYRWAILNKEFEFASSLSQCFTASPGYFYNLFLEVNRLGDDECLNHLFMEHSSLLENVDLYKQLEEQGQFNLLNKIIRQNKLKDDSYRLQLLNKAVERHDEKLVVALSKFVNSGYSTNATPVYKALAAHNSKGLILLLENGALLKDITASDVVDTLVKSNDIQLLHKVFEDKHFQSRFFDSNQLIRHLEKLYEKGNSELLGEFNKKFPEIDLKRLKDNPDTFKFSAFGENVKNIDGLFDQACSNRCLTVVNSLLETYQPKAREKESLFERLDDLFNAPYRTEKIRPFNPQLVRQRRQERESIEAKERDAASGANKRTPSVLQRLSPDQQKMMVQGQFHGKTPPPLQQRKSLDPLAKQAPVNPGDESAKPEQRKLPDPPVTRHPPVDTNDNTPIDQAMKKYHWRKVFDTLYDKKLGRLYSLIKNENYAPFEESHRKIEDVIINLRTSQKNLRRFADVAPARNERRASANSLLENKLILRALDEDHEDKLLPLMQQIKPEKPEALVNDRSNSLNDEVMALFKKYAKTGQTKVISNLFSFYEANSVIRLALEKAKQNKEEWGTLVGLLQSCTYTSPEHSSPPIDKELIVELEKHREDLLTGFKNAGRDIRMELVQLLDKKTDSALAWILKSEHGQVNTLLNTVEGEMVKAESSIPSATRSKVSRFMVGLDEFKNTIDKLQIRYNHFLETISSNDYAPTEALNELTAIKKEFQEGKLASYYFTDGALLDHLLNNLPKHNKDNIQDLLQIKQKIDQMSQTFVDYLEGFQKAGFNAKTALQQLEAIHQTFEKEQLVPAYFAEEKWIETLFEQLNKYKQKTINEPQILSFLTDLYKVISEEAGLIQKTTQAPQADQQKAREEKIEQARQQAEREAQERAAKEQAEREAQERAAKEQAEREAQERTAKEQAEREAQERAAKEQAEREAQERAAKEQAEREAQERAAKEQAEREAQERAAKEQAEREAQERAAKEQAEREAQERAAKEQAEREAQERAAKEQAEREAQERAAKEQAEREAQERAAKEQAEREAQERAAKEQAEREAQERAAKEQAEREAQQRAAKEQAEREAQERAAKEQAEREAQERAAKEQAEREAQERAAKEQAEREAQERAAKEQAEREAQERAAKEQAEREAQERAAKEQAEREAQERAAKEQAEREAQERAAKEQAEREAQERAAKEQAEREAQERAAKEQAEREAQERAAKEQAEREAQERAAKEQAEREAQERAAKEQAEREAQERAAKEQAEREAQRRQQAERARLAAERRQAEERDRKEAEQRKEQEQARQEAEAQERAHQEQQAERLQQAERARLAVERRQAEQQQAEERARELQAQQEREAKNEPEAQVVTIHPLMDSDEAQHKDQPSDSDKPSSALDLLIKAAKTYHADRQGKGKTLHLISWGQYTEDDKLGAANNFIDAVNKEDGFITAKDRGALKNGRLYTTLNSVFQDNRQAISRELNQDLQSFDDLLNALNKRQPVETLKRILDTYQADRATKPDYYHRTFFSQYSGPQKIASVKNFLETITRGDNLSPNDLAIIKQGSLGQRLNEFIKESGGALSEFLQREKPIKTIDDLVSAFYPPPQQEKTL